MPFLTYKYLTNKPFKIMQMKLMINYSNNLINSNIVQGNKKIEPQKKLHDSFSLKKKKSLKPSYGNTV